MSTGGMVEQSVIAGSRPARLLVVDGESRLGSRLTEPMAALSGLVPIVMELTAGRLALELLKSSPVDVVAADIDCLADLGDLAEDRIARLARAAAGALLVIVTPEASISVAIGAMRAGAHDCVSRPIEPEQLVERLGELARRHGKADALLGRPASPAPT